MEKPPRRVQSPCGLNVALLVLENDTIAICYRIYITCLLTEVLIPIVNWIFDINLKQILQHGVIYARRLSVDESEDLF